ncbi:hypothetical protein AB4554_08990, partial [Vibrio breoganii]
DGMFWLVRLYCHLNQLSIKTKHSEPPNTSPSSASIEGLLPPELFRFPIEALGNDGMFWLVRLLCHLSPLSAKTDHPPPQDASPSSASIEGLLPRELVRFPIKALGNDGKTDGQIHSGATSVYTPLDMVTTISP